MLNYNSKQKIYESTKLGWLHGFTTRDWGLNRDWKQRSHTFSTLLKTLYSNTSFYTPEQVHRHKVGLIQSVNGKKHSVISGCDALIGQKKIHQSQCLYIKTADCVPLIITEDKNMLAAVIHSGWRGTYENIIKQTVNQLRKNGAQTAKLKAVIGPAIGACCYDIPQSRYLLFKNKYPDKIKLITFRSPHKMHLDLSKMCYLQLIEAGLLAANITWQCLCTHCHEEMFFSFRRSQQSTGQLLTYVCL